MENGNKSAFGFEGKLRLSEGLTKREYFAALAMQGLLAADATYGGKTNDRDALTKDAVAFADSLLTELDRNRHA